MFCSISVSQKRENVLLTLPLGAALAMITNTGMALPRSLKCGTRRSKSNSTSIAFRSLAMLMLPASIKSSARVSSRLQSLLGSTHSGPLSIDRRGPSAPAGHLQGWEECRFKRKLKLLLSQFQARDSETVQLNLCVATRGAMSDVLLNVCAQRSMPRDWSMLQQSAVTTKAGH